MITTNKPHVVFIHLDLGIGGAESLVLNLAKATLPDESTAQADGNDNSPPPSGSVSIYTTHCSPSHCYDEVRPPDGPLSSHVHVRGSFIPRRLPVVGGTALCSAARMLYLTYVAARENPSANVFVIDVLPTGVPYLVERCNVAAGVIFYCHFPDKLLTRDTVNGEAGGGDGTGTNDASLIRFLLRCAKVLKRMYRWLLDSMEEWTMSYSDLIVVNSKFTRGEVEKVFPSLFLPRGSEGEHGSRVKVLYPSIESSLSKQRRGDGNADVEGENANATMNHTKLGPIVSLNRFERKKNVALVLHAYDRLLQRAANGQSTVNLPPLVIAGGYDPLNVENVEHLSELRALADRILEKYDLSPSTVFSPSKSSASAEDDAIEGIYHNERSSNPRLQEASIAFHPSISDSKRTKMLSCASAWCYTPHREHFGIVPLEAMNASVPVVAIRSGGPMETIVDGVTGYLVDYCPSGVESSDVVAAETLSRENATVRDFSHAIHNILSDPPRSRLMGQRGRERVDKLFGMDAFRSQWWELLREAEQLGLKRLTEYPRLSSSGISTLLECTMVFVLGLLGCWLWSYIKTRT